MSWTQFEVWAEVDGRQELIETTNSQKEAMSLAQKALNEGYDYVEVFRESDDGDYESIKTFKR